jgi:hypothetical protein
VVDSESSHRCGSFHPAARANRGVDHRARLDGYCVHSQFKTVRTDSLPLHGPLLSRDDRTGARSWVTPARDCCRSHRYVFTKKRLKLSADERAFLNRIRGLNEEETENLSFDDMVAYLKILGKVDPGALRRTLEDALIDLGLTNAELFQLLKERAAALAATWRV